MFGITSEKISILSLIFLLDSCTFSKIELHELQGCTCNIDTRVIADPVMDPNIQTSGFKTSPKIAPLPPKS